MRRILILAGIWVGLFLVTITFMVLKSHLASNAQAGEVSSQNPTSEDRIKEATRARLASMPRRSSGIATAVSDGFDSQRYLGLNEVVHTAIVAAKDQLLDCTRDSMNNSPLRTQYLEVSFDFARVSNAGSILAHGRVFSITNASVERSSIRFSVREEQCMERAFNSITISTDLEMPSGRNFYPLCINRSK